MSDAFRNVPILLKYARFEKFGNEFIPLHYVICFKFIFDPFALLIAPKIMSKNCFKYIQVPSYQYSIVRIPHEAL